MINSTYTRVKICGITSTEDAVAAAEAGADAIGLVFYEKSPRYISDLGRAKEMIAEVGPFVNTVALTVNATEREIENLLDVLPVSLIQFHGDESNSFCQKFGRPYIKALRVRDGLDIVANIEQFPDAQAILLDSYTPGIPGGTGEAFNWEKVPMHAPKHIILAGGLSSENVRAAIRTTEPYGVDVSSGVEFGPGKKDKRKIETFIQKVKSE